MSTNTKIVVAAVIFLMIPLSISLRNFFDKIESHNENQDADAQDGKQPKK